MANEAQWAELLEPGLREIFEVQRDALAAVSRIPMLFHLGDSIKAHEHFLGAGSMNLWEEYKGSISYDDIEKLYETTLTHKEFSKGFSLERKLYDDDLYNEIKPQPAQLAMSAILTRETHAASMFGNSFTEGYVGGDGVALCSASHPLAPGHATDVWGNAGSSPLSAQAVIATRKLMRRFRDDRGHLVPVNPDSLLIPAALEDAGQVIQQSQLKPGTADNDWNYAGSLIKNIIVWDYLDDYSTTNWFMFDSSLMDMYSQWMDRVPLEFTVDPNSDFLLRMKCRGYMRYSFGWSDWRWIYGHQV